MVVMCINIIEFHYCLMLTRINLIGFLGFNRSSLLSLWELRIREVFFICLLIFILLFFLFFKTLNIVNYLDFFLEGSLFFYFFT